METQQRAGLPLQGVRIVDFTWAGVGGYCSMLWSMLGAECIKIETFQGKGISRKSNPVRRNTQHSSLFEELNVNKRSILLNLKRPEAVAIVKSLVARSNAVAENFRPGVIDRLGAGYEALREVNPGIVMLSMSVSGATGPDHGDVGYAGVFGAMSGISELIGYEDGPPVELRFPSDMISGTMGAFAMIAALVHQQQTGIGQYIDCSNRETLGLMIGDALLDYFANGRIQTRQGNRHVAWAPHNCYRCAGDDRWISIVATNDEQWRALANAIGGPDLVGDPRFADGFLRNRNLQALDERISAWTADKSDYELMRQLQAVGVPAAPTMHPDDLLTDPHLAARDWWRLVERGERQPWIMGRSPWTFSRTPTDRYEQAPDAGRDTRDVLGGLLGISDEQLEQLESIGAVG